MPQKKKTKTGLVLSFLKLFVFLYTQSLQSGPTHCDPTDNSLPGSSVHGILQARILEWVAMSTSRGSSWPRDRTCISYISCNGRWVFFTTSTAWESWSSFLKSPFSLEVHILWTGKTSGLSCLWLLEQGTWSTWGSVWLYISELACTQTTQGHQ